MALKCAVVPMSPSETRLKKALPLTLLRPPAADSGKLRGKEPSAVNTHAHTQATLSPRQKGGLPRQLATGLL